MDAFHHRSPSPRGAPVKPESGIAAARTNMLQSDDAALARALREGDSRAARAAWQRFAPMVRRTIRRRMGNEADIDDVVQQVFLCFFERIATLQEPQALKSFLFSITLNIVRAEARRNRVRRALWRNWVPPPSSIDPNPEAREALAHFCRILDRLGPRDGSAFMQRFVDNEDLADVASIHGVSLSTIKRRLTRIQRRVAVQVKRDPALCTRLVSSRAPESLDSTV